MSRKGEQVYKTMWGLYSVKEDYRRYLSFKCSPFFIHRLNNTFLVGRSLFRLSEERSLPRDKYGELSGYVELYRKTSEFPSSVSLGLIH